MNAQQNLNYNRIAEAIDFIKNHFKEQPNLDEVASNVHLSPFHFQRLFNDWAGTTPKKFLQFISLEHAKKILKEQQATLFDAAYETGLSGTGRLHDLFVNIEGMTPAEFKNGGKNLVINYCWETSPFGSILVASTAKGLCYMAFAEEEGEGMAALVNKFPEASLQTRQDVFQQDALSIFRGDWSNIQQVKLHLKGTP